MTTEGLARDAYLGVDVELPNGETVRCTPLPLTKSIELLELVERYQQGDIGAMRKILRDFPKAVGADGAFEQLTPGGLIDVVFRFFAVRRTPASPTATGPTAPSPSPSTR